jgi:hypothetical protein
MAYFIKAKRLLINKVVIACQGRKDLFRRGPCTKKSKNKAGMLLISNALPFLESCESWNVYENTASYAKKLECY